MTLLQENKLTVTSSGNNHLVLGDSNGQVHLITRSWYIRTFRAYEMTIELAHQLRNSPLLVTIGVPYNSIVGLWDKDCLVTAR